MAGILTVDTIQSDSSYASTLNVASKMNFTSGMQIGGQDTTFGNRNKIINGAMQIAQRNTSVSSVSSSGYYAADRMSLYFGSSSNFVVTVSQASDGPAGFTTCHKVQTTTANTTIGTNEYCGNLYYVVENRDIQDFAWGTASAKPVTVSFWVKSNKTGTYGFSPYISTGGSYYVVTKTYTINAADTWEYKTITLPPFTTTTIPNDNAGALSLYWNIRCGTGYTSGTAATNWSTYTTTNWSVGHTVQFGTSTADYISITGIQLEKGSVATPFEFRPYAQELGLCQRYYEVMTFPSGSGGIPVTLGQSYQSRKVIGPFCFKVDKRAAPSVPNATIGIDGGDGSHTFQFFTTSSVATGYGTGTSPSITAPADATEVAFTLYIAAEL
jgi:hypothetical protein